MKDKIINYIIEKARQGDYGLMVRLIENSSERLLLQTLPQDLRMEVSDNMVGNDIFVITATLSDGRQEQISYIDEIEAMSSFQLMVVDHKKDAKYASAKLQKGKILGGNDMEGWRYSLKDAKLFWEEVFDKDSIEGTDFDASVTFNISGKMRSEFTKEDLSDYLQEIKPSILNESLVAVEVEFEACKLNVKEK